MPNVTFRTTLAIVLTFGIGHWSYGTDSYPWRLPRGLPVPRVPADNPISQAKIDLGRRLFYDKRLSGNTTYSCASCHQQAFAFTDGLARALGSTGAEHARSTMTLTNVAYNVTYGWADSGLRTLEAQMLVPMFNEHPIEMGIKGHEAQIVARFSSRGDAVAFGAAFPREPAPVSLDNIVKAIASFERTLVSADSPFDRYLYRDANAAANLRSRPFYFNYVDVNPKNAEEVWVNALSLYKSTDGARTFQVVQAPHGDMHGMWFNPDTPNIAIQCNDGGATVTTDGGRSWSSILNQPTAEIYMVSVDDQHPYRLYGPQQDNSTFVVPSVPPYSWTWDAPAQAWTQASGCETGGIWPRPDGSVVWGACKGEVERYSVLTGQSQGTWVYPQNRYGQDPDNIKYRFPRSTVIYLSPHNPNVVYQASHVLHRSTDDGVTWQVISPDLTAHEPDLQVVPGRPITRDVTGEEVYSSIYSMVESRLEPGVIWVGANDGPVSVTRDNGRTWKRVTPKDLPIGGRVQNIEDSPHRKGTAYIAVYRYLREHDLKPYIYVTTDYGDTWTRLTDGSNGIPDDFPTRVVREDPDRAGLLYAGTEFGAFVSFDNGRHWQSLQQNLPATPVTDLRVHRKDLVIATMGRAFWIMDDVSPLQQAAADSAQPTLLQPRDAVRYRYAAAGRGAAEVPQYPPVGATIDYVLPQGFTGALEIAIVNAAGTVVRTVSSAGEGGGGAGPKGRGRGAPAADAADALSGEQEEPQLPQPGRGRGAMQVLTARPGHNRFVWDYRWEDNGPMVAPGRYTVRLKSGAVNQSKSFTVTVDPRVTKDGVTQADLVAQERFLLQVRDAIRQANALRGRIQEAMQQKGVPPPPAPGVGESPESQHYVDALQGLWARVVSAGGTYPEPMLIEQLQNIQRMVGAADQKVGQEAIRRLDDLTKELKAIEAAVPR